MTQTDKCPRCGEPLEYDEVDNGVGIERGNPGCPSCFWTPEQEPEAHLRIMVACPNCEAAQEDLDGFGVCFCPECGFCTHMSIDGDICNICKKRITPCKECHGRGTLQGHAGIDDGAECGACEGTGNIVEEVEPEP